MPNQFALVPANRARPVQFGSVVRRCKQFYNHVNCFESDERAMSRHAKFTIVSGRVHEEIQTLLESAKRNKPIFERIAKEMNKAGYNKTAE